MPIDELNSPIMPKKTPARAIQRENGARKPQKGRKVPLWRRVMFWVVRIILGLAILSMTMLVVYRFVPVPITWLMIQRVAEGHQLHKKWVPIDKISPNLRRAVIAGEDAHFCTHNGFDFDAIEAAIDANKAGRRVRGGSTISQQTAKNVFLWPSRSWVRKGLEVGFTIGIETVWTKRRILEVYLNVVEFGQGVYGAEAAAHYYYGKSAASLTQREAAGLAAILPLPLVWDPNHPSRRVRGRVHRVLRNGRAVRNEGLDYCVLNRPKHD